MRARQRRRTVGGHRPPRDVHVSRGPRRRDSAAPGCDRLPGDRGGAAGTACLPHGSDRGRRGKARARRSHREPRGPRPRGACPLPRQPGLAALGRWGATRVRRCGGRPSGRRRRAARLAGRTARARRRAGTRLGARRCHARPRDERGLGVSVTITSDLPRLWQWVHPAPGCVLSAWSRPTARFSGARTTGSWAASRCSSPARSERHPSRSGRRRCEDPGRHVEGRRRRDRFHRRRARGRAPPARRRGDRRGRVDPERAAAKGIAPVYESYDALLADDRVDVVHLTTPNHLHHEQVKRALEAGKHVVCEKPLALTSDQSRELLHLARASGLVHCTNFNIRFYPLVQEVRARVRDGELGQLWSVHGGYLQDWLALPTDWNWRLEIDRAAAPRRRRHRVALAGPRAVRDRVPRRRAARRSRHRDSRAGAAGGEVETFAAAADVERASAPMSTEDFAHVLLRFDNGMRGSLVLSQVSIGRKNSFASRSTARKAPCPGTASATRSSGSGTGTPPTRRSSATRR